MTSKRRIRYSCPTLVEANPKFLLEWDSELNGESRPSDYTLGSDRKVWWRCRKNSAHIWSASPSNRYYGETGCPYCTGRKLDESRSIALTHPDLAAQWCPLKNNALRPTDVSSGSHKKVNWRCKKGHEWMAAVYSRANGRGCPFCSGYYVQSENSVAALRPDLLMDWHPEKNGSLSPTEVSLGSEKAIWWRCRYGHEWQATLQNRHHNGSGCPKCTRQSSRPEIRLFCELRTIFSNISHRVKVGIRIEVDLLIPLLNLVVQYDGKRYHGSKVEKDRTNTEDIEALGFQVIRVRDRSLPEIGTTLSISENVGLSVHDIHRFLILLQSVAPLHTHEAGINEYLARDRFAAEDEYIDLCSALPGPLPGKSLQDMHPAIAAEWHVEKNGRLAPTQVTPKSGIKVFWKCDRHEFYLAPVGNRVEGRGCPYCSRRVVRPEDSLGKLYPVLASEFHPTKNGDKQPFQIPPGTSKKYWWFCSRNPKHEWEATVFSRVNGCNCPLCINKKIIPENSLAALAPEVACQWNYEKNFPVQPDEVARASSKVVWWRCAVDPSHEWAANISNRTRLGVGCPYCNGKKTDPKKSLAAIRPDLACEWHRDLNNRNADSVLPRSGRTAWWQCQNDPAHVWQARVDSRSNGHKKCPLCYPKQSKRG